MFTGRNFDAILALARNWEIPSEKLLATTETAGAARRAYQSTGYDPPMHRGPNKDRPKGSITAARPDSIPRRRDLNRIAVALERAAESLGDDRVTAAIEWRHQEGGACLPSYEEDGESYALDELASASRKVGDVLAALAPADQLVIVRSLLIATAEDLRQAVPSGSKCRPSPLWGGWEGDAVRLAWDLWSRDLGRGRGWNRRRSGLYNAWECFCREWLVLLGVDLTTEGLDLLLTEEPPPAWRLRDRLDASGILTGGAGDSLALAADSDSGTTS